MRQVIMSEWLNQQAPLGFLQKRITVSLLYKDVRDPDAVGEAVAVLNAHIEEDEEEIVRHLVYVALTSKNPDDAAIALNGLKKVSTKHKEIAVASFLYHLQHTHPVDRRNVKKMVACVSGLAKLSGPEAVPYIQTLANHPSGWLAHVAQRAIAQVTAPDQRVGSESPKN